MTAGQGQDRYAWNRSHGVVDKAVKVHKSPQHNDRMAKEAEDYFGRLYGLRLSGNNRPVDAEFVVDGVSIDVKWTPYETGHLIHAMSSKTRSAVYVLVVGEEPSRLRIAGWAWGKDLHHSVVGPPKFPIPTYALRQDELRRSIDLMMGALGQTRG